MKDQARPATPWFEVVPPTVEPLQRDVPTVGWRRARAVVREERTGRRRRRRVLWVAALLLSCGPAAPAVEAVNGCEAERYVDRSASTADRRVGFGTALGSGAVSYEPRCMRIAPGQAVTFVGDFSTHPLSSGSSAQHDAGVAGNPIERRTSGAVDYPVTFTAAGLYPFYCELHEPTMAGAIWVQ